MQYHEVASIPMKLVGPLKIISQEFCGEVKVPMATFETPLWPSTSRGAKVSRVCGGIEAIVIDDRMTRSIVVEAPSAQQAYAILADLDNNQGIVEQAIAATGRFAKLKDWNSQVVGNLLYIRIAISSGDASGHNMVTAAAENFLNWLLANYRELKYISISANFCVDKKASAVNGILGRGKYVVAEILIPRDICREVLKSTPEKIIDLHIKKNLIGTMLAGGIRSANAHFANMLLAVYLATGQDAANIIEGSQGMVHAELKNDSLYFSVTLPNIIVGTVGNGKHLSFAKDNLKSLGCFNEQAPGKSARKLAIIIAATVLCGELSLLAAQTNQGELMRTHFKMERAVGNKQTADQTADTEMA